ncbi:mCG1047697, partial [Mus musculus]
AILSSEISFVLQEKFGREVCITIVIAPVKLVCVSDANPSKMGVPYVCKLSNF